MQILLTWNGSQPQIAGKKLPTPNRVACERTAPAAARPTISNSQRRHYPPPPLNLPTGRCHPEEVAEATDEGSALKIATRVAPAS